LERHLHSPYWPSPPFTSRTRKITANGESDARVEQGSQRIKKEIDRPSPRTNVFYGSAAFHGGDENSRHAADLQNAAVEGGATGLTTSSNQWLSAFP
jgi:hypothetical protein